MKGDGSNDSSSSEFDETPFASNIDAIFDCTASIKWPERVAICSSGVAVDDVDDDDDDVDDVDEPAASRPVR